MLSLVQTIAYISEPTCCWYSMTLISDTESEGRVMFKSIGILTSQELVIS